MKKMLLFIALCFITSGLFAQNADSLAVAKVVDSLIKVSRILTDKREFDKALEVNGLAEKVAVEKWGAISIPYANVCANQGRIHQQGNQNQAAEKWLLQSLDMREKLLGKEHQDYAFTQNALGNVYRSLGNFEKAETAYLEAARVRKKIFGPLGIEYARTLTNMAHLYKDMRRYDDAENFYIETKNIREKGSGKNSDDYIRAIRDLGFLYSEEGMFEKAERYYLEALHLRGEKAGKTDQTYAEILNNLGSHYDDLDDFEQSERYYLESIKIFEETIGEKHEYFPSALMNMGLLYVKMGNYSIAETYIKRSMNIFNKFPPNSLPYQYYSKPLQSMSAIFFYQGQYEKAKEYMLDAASIIEKNIGNTNIEYGASIINIAIIEAELGNFEKANSLLLQTKSIIEATNYNKSYGYSGILSNFAKVYRIIGDFQNAELCYKQILQIIRNTKGSNNQDYADYLGNLAAVNLVTNRENTALDYYKEANQISQTLITQSLHYLSEQQLNKYLKRQSQSYNEILQFAQKHGSSPTCYDNALFHKGFLQNAAIRVNRPVLRDSATTEQYYLFKSLHRRLAAEYAKPIAERKNVEDMENRANDIEKELARKIAGYGEALRQVKWQEVQSALKADEAAIEFVHYRYWNKKETDSILYAALVLRPGMTQPQFIPLFEEKQLEALLDHKGQAPDLFYKNLYTWEGKGQTLYQLVWQSLAQALAGAKTVYHSPSGLLHRLNLGAIPSATKLLAGDQFRLVGLSSTRQLVSNVGRVSNPANVNAILYGGIQYDMDSTAVLREEASFPSETSTGLRGQLRFSYSDSTLRGGSWKYLPGTEKEVADLEKITTSSGHKTQILKGLSATEARFKAMPGSSPRVLHLATHGFFFPDPNTVGSGRATSDDEHIVFKSSDHPLMRSGLILAGGNYAWQNGKPFKPNMEDGILTAYEISQIDLSGTELVVLSACETGLGDIKGSEGVYGLQRAFKIAGAKHILMSLWQVPDQQTARLMSLFYNNWLTKKMTVADALRAAQQHLRDRGYDPFYWAGFVLVE